MDRLLELPPLIETRFSPIDVVDETGSTNADLLAAGREGTAQGAVLVAGHQTAGRGRQQRTWHDEPGSALLVSVLLRPDRHAAPLMPLLSGVAAVDSLRVLASELQGTDAETPAVAGLKWPNDVLAPSLGERKLAGILSESTNAQPKGSPGSNSNDGFLVVCGMGMNLRWGRPPPDEIVERAATVAELLDAEVERERVLHLYLRALEYWLRRLEADGSEALLDGYRTRCLTLGRQVRFETSTSRYFGVARDVSSSGTLMLDTAEHGLVELHAGDAHHVL